MSFATDIKRLDQRPIKEALINKTKFRLFGLDTDDLIKVFFAGNAWIAIIVLALITFSLFKEGAGFFPQHYSNLVIYRTAGLEYVDIIRDQFDAHATLRRFLSEERRIRTEKLKAHGKTDEEITAAFATFDPFYKSFDEASIPLNDLIKEMSVIASDIKERSFNANEAKQIKKQLMDAGKVEDANAVEIEKIDMKLEVQKLKEFAPRYHEVNAKFVAELKDILARMPVLNDHEIDAKMQKFKSATQKYLDGIPMVENRLSQWHEDTPVGWYESITKFIFGTRWITQSFWQDWYGMIPLFVGSLAVGLVAVIVAVPLGVGAAIYVNQVATKAEQNFIKPYIEFISAIPSVVLGFFGIAILGEGIRWFSGLDVVSWIPFFPIAERLNIITAGLLLAIMTIPTVFTLSEDAIQNVPIAFKEASFALGATKLQTILRIIVPAALSGIISAVLLGLGRVIGETMVVLLCSGGRIEIPDFTQGIGFIFQPVHTMTGLIAQEVPEVVRESLQYRALFMLALVLFFLSLLINYLAQFVVKKFKISIG